MARFIIRGGKRLSGFHKSPGNKNAVLPMLAACVLTDKPITLRNIPLIDDVRTMLAILDDLGVTVDLTGHSVTLCAKGLRKSKLNAELCRKVRSSLLFAGPMTARLGHVTLSPPGGDIIGRRRIDTHLDGLKSLGIQVKGNSQFVFSCRKLGGSSILLDEASVTATENILMAAVLAKGKTSIFNAACEPHIQDLCIMLNNMGAQITGVGTNFLKINGVESLRGISHTVGPDYIDMASFITAAAVTGGDLKIEDPSKDHLQIVSRTFGKLGINWHYGKNFLHLKSNQRFRVQNDFASAIPKIEDGVWPNFPSDLMSVAIVLATQARGTVLFFEKMFESRMYFVDRLIEMGAQIVQCDPHRVVVAGGAKLHGIHLSSPDIRAGMALLIAALCARGESIVDNAQTIDRGYEQVDHKLRRLGADIERIN
ncbi:MAG: UDP-N-acetylglucosamine 1-carboxyvinyltransferase [Kiritimatiellae bacterium]|nr:UDP-N-acetylglucosamine 1-carboxyvinyltransferase [Kiritimatiellia bacterium]MDD5519222.1 UDP-N-acetylglucosamine 1-carboxyvinyltransferase [Kiritimatiellia bacterium]